MKKKKSIKYRRTSEIKLTNEARLLRELRVSKGISIREVGRRLGCSETYIRHIEKGRLDLPDKSNLIKVLTVYEVSYRQFLSRLKKYVGTSSREELEELVKAIPDEKIEVINQVIRGIIKLS